jgi:hypothetical protein
MLVKFFSAAHLDVHTLRDEENPSSIQCIFAAEDRYAFRGQRFVRGL